jgi:hypothetical protein
MPADLGHPPYERPGSGTRGSVEPLTRHSVLSAAHAMITEHHREIVTENQNR